MAASDTPANTPPACPPLEAVSIQSPGPTPAGAENEGPSRELPTNPPREVASTALAGRTSVASVLPVTTTVLAMGSRQANKIPQDAAALAYDEATRTRAYVVADGASEAGAPAGIVRQFTRRLATCVARRLVACGATAEGAADPSRWLAEIRSAVAVLNDDGRWAGSAAVAGGILWVPASRRLFLFAIGNIALLTFLEAEGMTSDGPWLIGTNTLLEHGKIPSNDDIKHGQHEVPVSSRLRAIISSDGTRLAAIMGSHEHLAVLRRAEAEDPDYVDDLLVPEMPADDVTRAMFSIDV